MGEHAILTTFVLVVIVVFNSKLRFRTFLGVKFGLKVLLRVKRLTFCNSAEVDFAFRYSIGWLVGCYFYSLVCIRALYDRN